MENKTHGVSHLLAALRYSISGLRAMIKETAFRYEMMLGILHVTLLLLCRPDLYWSILLSVLYVLILIAEAFNTAIEAVVDLVSPDYNIMAGKAKDVGSLGVLFSLILYGVSTCVYLYHWLGA